MMFVMIAEMIAAEQRPEPSEAAASGAMIVGERIRFDPVRTVGSEVEKLQRGEDRGQRPEGQDIGEGRAEGDIERHWQA